MVGVRRFGVRACGVRAGGAWGAVCGQADAGGVARMVVGGGAGGAAVSRLGLGALAGVRTRRRALLPRASRGRVVGLFGGVWRAIRPDWCSSR